MKCETLVDNKPGKLTVGPNSFTYEIVLGSSGRQTGEAEHPRRSPRQTGDDETSEVGANGAITAGYTIEALGRNDFSVLSSGRSFQVSVLPNGEVSVNGRVFHVQVFDPRRFRGRQANGAATGKRIIAAPMPGRVIRILVEAGQTVEAGQGLIVVEAMKMQNEMKAPHAGTVTKIKTSLGATVTAGDVLLVME